MFLIVVFLSLLPLFSVRADDSFILRSGENHTIHHAERSSTFKEITKIVVRANARADREEAVIEVIADGEVKATLHIEEYGHSFEISIEDQVGVLEFRHESGGEATILSVQFEYGAEFPKLRVDNRAMYLSAKAMTLIDQLEDQGIDRDQHDKYLLPIFNAAASAYDEAAVSSEFSPEIPLRLKRLQKEISQSSEYLEKLRKGVGRSRSTRVPAGKLRELEATLRRALYERK